MTDEQVKSSRRRKLDKWSQVILLLVVVGMVGQFFYGLAATRLAGEMRAQAEAHEKVVARLRDGYEDDRRFLESGYVERIANLRKMLAEKDALIARLGGTAAETGKTAVETLAPLVKEKEKGNGENQ